MKFTAEYDDALIRANKRHAGLYRRVADKLQVNVSYVSRVADGHRGAPTIRYALLAELRSIQRPLHRLLPVARR